MEVEASRWGRRHNATKNSRPVEKEQVELEVYVVDD